jgi:hypothetical protein
LETGVITGGRGSLLCMNTTLRYRPGKFDDPATLPQQGRLSPQIEELVLRRDGRRYF